jgi:uncharacterized protein YecE (DUF72 family)
VAGSVFIGISGWRYAPWRGVFYPEGLVQRRELEFASRAFPTIELNGSFYSLQRPELFAQWYDQTPRGFVFSVKGGRYVTHVLRLREAGKALANFFASGVLRLNEKLGPFLWQLPPTLRYDAAQMEGFLSILPRDTQAAAALAAGHDDWMKGRVWLEIDHARPLRHAMEVRHASFAHPGFIERLRRHDVALVVADSPGKWPYMEDVTSNFMYLRLHGEKELYASGYTAQALDGWAQRVKAWCDGGEPDDAKRVGGPARSRAARDVYCYFDNDAKVRAPFDAAGLIERMRDLRVVK